MVDTCKFRFWLVPALLLFCALARPGAVKAECMYASTNVLMPGGTMTILVEKYLTMKANCASIPTQMNAVDCNPGTMVHYTDLLSGEAMTATVSPNCAWNCDCGTVTIDGSDGLPVELLDFKVSALSLPPDAAPTLASVAPQIAASLEK